MHAFLLAAAMAASRLNSAIASVLARPALAHSSIGLAVYDLDAHRMIYSSNGERYFLSASTTKLLTEASALAVLGQNYRFRTNVYRTGEVDATGTLHGNVVLKASGDPNLSGRILPGGTLAFENQDHSYDGGPDTQAVPGDPLAVLRDFGRQIAARGIRRIAGSVIVDDSLFPGGFTESGTGAVVSPIVLNDNIVDITVAPGLAPGDPVRVRVSPQTAYVAFSVQAKTATADTRRSVQLLVRGVDSRGTQLVTIAGTLPVDSPPILYAYDVPSPRQFAQDAFAQILRADGIAITAHRSNALDPRVLARFYRHGNLIATHLSPPLSQDVKVTLKVSDNLHADTMPYIWGRGDLDAAFATERAYLQRAGLDPGGAVQNDGLGGDAFIQPDFMVRFLAYVRTQRYFPAIYNGLPIMGVDGTLYNVEPNSPAAGKVRAKTGTWSSGDLLNGRGIVTAKGLAGYMTDARGRHLAFCFYLNNFTTPADDAEYEAGALLGELATATYLYAN